jgi:hypothetical protein
VARLGHEWPGSVHGYGPGTKVGGESADNAPCFKRAPPAHSPVRPVAV